MSEPRAQEDRAQETVVARIRPHPRRLFWPTVLLLADIGALGYFAPSLEPGWMLWTALGAAALIALFGFFVPVLSWLGRNYTITTRRIVLRSGLFVRLRQELLHSRGYDVTVRRAGLQVLFRSGDVLINTGLEHPLVLEDVPDADLVQSALHDLMEESSSTIAARRQSGQARGGRGRYDTDNHDPDDRVDG